MAYERKQYAVAVVFLENEYPDARNEATKGRKAYLLGQSYYKLQEYTQSVEWFEKAIKHDYGAEALGNFANVSRVLENYEAAISAYQLLKTSTGRNQEFDREILLCRQAIQNKQKKSEYRIEKLFENSSVSDYSPVIYEDDFLVFTSERSESTGKQIYNWTGEKFSDIFIIQKNGSEVKKFDSSLNSENNDGTPWFSKDNERMYFTRCFSFGTGDDRCKVMFSRRLNEVWEEPKVLPFVDDKFTYGQPTLVENDSILVFVSDIEEPGGKTDLYYAELLADGTWSAPEKLPSSINTQGNEKFPTGDGDTLYFSSDYLPGFGGYDIFKTYLRKDFTWAPPYNLGYGINSGGDDFSYMVDYKAKTRSGIAEQGYFTSNRSGSGKDDIYKFGKLISVITKVPVDTIPTTETSPLVRSIFVSVRSFTPEFLISGDPNSEIKGKATLPSTAMRLIDESNIKIAEGYTNENGFYYCSVPEGRQIKVTAAKQNYLSSSASIDTRSLKWEGDETTKTINVELVLEKIYENKEINLKNIYYDYDKWDIKPEAVPTLNQLTTILNDNPRINIQLSSHTDCRGLEDYNMILSQKRAQSVVDYLISKGIDEKRLVAVGYGKSLLIENCECEKCTENQHQVNRRTTFKIINRP